MHQLTGSSGATNVIQLFESGILPKGPEIDKQKSYSEDMLTMMRAMCRCRQGKYDDEEVLIFKAAEHNVPFGT
ncbi:hypothetical protein BOTCAL_0430g00050 [Botryotinia calthae]|uniref:Uncharacterized protein n=1 Tax=Botryotinia calthae TaxID=38488 RepID=A0A4Y8CQP5_9HELO|nr:hypothetical protein BOTCAL_0430g00050 [Botryotinia calthae]